eukprot:scpid76770/ scgid26713/ Coiled-coil domain-containing protein 149
MSVSRTDWDLLVTEYKAVKKQLRSKQEALRLLQQQVKTLEEDCLRFKEIAKQSPVHEGPQPLPPNQLAKPSTPSTASASKWLNSDPGWKRPTGDSGEQIAGLETQLDALTFQYREVVQEKQALQQRVERLEAANREKGVQGLISERDKALKERNELVEQLEKARTHASEVQLDLDSCREEVEEATREKMFFSGKCDRLNKQLLRCIQERKSSPEPEAGEFVDIDAMQLENKYLKERLAKSGEEKQELIEAMSKSKQRAPRLRQALRNATADMSSAIGRNDPKDHTDVGAHTTAVGSTGNSAGAGGSGGSKTMKKVYSLRSTIADLQAMVATLSDSLRDKNLALQHSKAVNKTLAQRVMAMEQKLGSSAVSTGTTNIATSPLVPASQATVAVQVNSDDNMYSPFTLPSVAGSQGHDSAYGDIDLADLTATQQTQQLHEASAVPTDAGSNMDSFAEMYNQLGLDSPGNPDTLAGRKDRRINDDDDDDGDDEGDDDAVEWQREQIEADQSLGIASSLGLSFDGGVSSETSNSMVAGDCDNHQEQPSNAVRQTLDRIDENTCVAHTLEYASSGDGTDSVRPTGKEDALHNDEILVPKSDSNTDSDDEEDTDWLNVPAKTASPLLGVSSSDAVTTGDGDTDDQRKTAKFTEKSRLLPGRKQEPKAQYGGGEQTP